jgi:hypothetical protein
MVVRRRNVALESPRYSNEQLLAEVDKVTLAQVKALQARLLPEVEVEALLCGNVVPEQATQLVAKLQAALASKPLPRERRPVRRLRMLPEGERALRQFVAANPDEVNSATEVYLQVGRDEGDDWVLLALLNQIISKAFYSELRTKQQLGYIVQCGANEISGVRGLSFLVQSKVQPPDVVEERIGAFLRLFRGTLVLLDDAQVREYTASLAAQFTDVSRPAAWNPPPAERALSRCLSRARPHAAAGRQPARRSIRPALERVRAAAVRLRAAVAQRREGQATDARPAARLLRPPLRRRQPDAPAALDPRVRAAHRAARGPAARRRDQRRVLRSARG